MGIDFKVDIDKLSETQSKLNDEAIKMEALCTKLKTSLTMLDDAWDSDARRKMMESFDKDYDKPIRQYAELIRTMSLSLNKAKSLYGEVVEEGKKLKL